MKIWIGEDELYPDFMVRTQPPPLGLSSSYEEAEVPENVATFYLAARKVFLKARDELMENLEVLE